MRFSFFQKHGRQSSILFMMAAIIKAGCTHYYEVDFLISNGNKISAFEVKSSGTGKYESIGAFAKKFSANIGTLYVLSQKDVGTEGSLQKKPVYLTPFLVE